MKRSEKGILVFGIILMGVVLFLLESLIITALYNYSIKYLLWVMFSYNARPISFVTGMLLTFSLGVIHGTVSTNHKTSDKIKERLE